MVWQIAAKAVGKKVAKTTAKRAVVKSVGRNKNSDTERRKRQAVAPSDTEHLPFGKTSDEYARAHTEEKRVQRRQQAKFKSQAEWDEMKRQNPHIKDEFIDSPIVSAKKLTDVDPIKFAASAAKKAKSIEVTVNLGWVVVPWWLFAQLPLWVLSITSFGIALGLGMPDAVATSLKESSGFAKLVIDTASLVTEYIPGLNLITSIASETLNVGSGVFMGLSIGASAFITGMGLALLVFGAISYTLAGVKWWSGKYHTLKVILFLVAIIGYGSFFLNFLPYALPWMLVVAFNPE